MTDRAVSVEFIERRHEDRRRPPRGIDLARRIVELEALRLDLEAVLDGCPESFLLNLKGEAGARQSEQSWKMMEWADRSSVALQEWTVGAEREIPMDSVNSRDVLRANVYPSIVSRYWRLLKPEQAWDGQLNHQYVLRYYALQYREELVALVRAQRLESSLFRLEDLCKWNELERSTILAELLTLLHKVPIIALGSSLFSLVTQRGGASYNLRLLIHAATNSLAAVNKVRYVIVSLLDDLVTPAGTSATSKQVQAQQYLSGCFAMCAHAGRLIA